MTAYEFTESQNQQINEIAGKLSSFSILVINCFMVISFGAIVILGIKALVYGFQ